MALGSGKLECQGSFSELLELKIALALVVTVAQDNRGKNIAKNMIAVRTIISVATSYMVDIPGLAQENLMSFSSVGSCPPYQHRNLDYQP